MPIKIIRPANRSKVSNPKVQFSWVVFNKATSYVVRLYKTDNTKVPNFPSTPAVTTEIRNTFFETVLEQDKVYRFEVIPKVSRQLLPAEAGRVDFYVKEVKDYSANYLNYRILQKRKDIKPTEQPDIKLSPFLPIYYFMLERYTLGKAETEDDVKYAKLFRQFEAKMQTKIPDFTAAGHFTKLKKSYDKIDKVDLFQSFPIDAELKGLDWYERIKQQIANKALRIPLIQDIKNTLTQSKNLDFEAGDKLFPFNGMNIDLSNPLKKPIDVAFYKHYKLNISNHYILRISTFESNPVIQKEFVDIPLRLVAVRPQSPRPAPDEYYFVGILTRLNQISSARYRLLIYDITNDSKCSKAVISGYAVIKGGKPIILDVRPRTKIYSGSNVPSAIFDLTMTLRDGGEPATGGQAIQAKKPFQGFGILEPSEGWVKGRQTLHSQEYTFKNCNVWEWSANPQYNPYQLVYKRNDRVPSVNSIPFTIQGQQFQITAESITCNDVSNPEWWCDTISFSAFSQTPYLGLTPDKSNVYEGFDNGVTNPVPANDQLKTFFPYNSVEDYFTVTVAIYEHDDLGILEWVLNAIVDFIVNFLINAIADFVAAAITVVTLGAGSGFGALIGLAIYTGLKGCLEEIGFNDAKEELINEIVSSMEIELLLEKTFNLIQLIGVYDPGFQESGSKTLPLQLSSAECAYDLNIRVDWKI